MAGLQSILSAIRSSDSRLGVVSVSYDSKSPHGNINNKVYQKAINLHSYCLAVLEFTLRLVGSAHTMEESLKIHIKEQKTFHHPFYKSVTVTFEMDDETGYVCKAEVEICNVQMQHLFLLLSS